MSTTLAPLLSAPAPIAAHAAAALVALVLGVWQLAGRKGGPRHRIVGWVFVVLLAFVAISALWISEIRLFGPFSPIHLLIPVTLYTLVQAIRAARAGRLDYHKKAMTSLVIFALLITGAFTLLPGRAMHAVVLGNEANAE